MTDFLKLGLRFLETVGLRGDKSLCSVRKKEGEEEREKLLVTQIQSAYCTILK